MKGRIAGGKVPVNEENYKRRKEEDEEISNRKE